jgi:hypothetical protein
MILTEIWEAKEDHGEYMRETLLSHCDPDLHVAVMLAFLTGARKQGI